MAMNKIERVQEPNGHSYWRLVGDRNQYERCANKAVAESLRDYLNNYGCDVAILGGTVDSGYYAMQITGNAACVLSYESGVLTDFSKHSDYRAASEHSRHLKFTAPKRQNPSACEPKRAPDPEPEEEQTAVPEKPALNKVEQYREKNGHLYWRVTDGSDVFERCASKAIATKLCDILNKVNTSVSTLSGTAYSGHYGLYTSGCTTYVVLTYQEGRLTECSTAENAVAREAEMQRRSAALPIPKHYSSQKPIGLPDPEETQSNAQPTANQDQEEETMATTNKIDIKSEAIEAGVRTSVAQVVKLLHEPLVALLTAKLSVPGEDPSAFAKRLSEFLKEDIGRAVVSALLGLAFQNLPPAALAGLGIDATMSAMVAKELRVNAMALVGGEVADLLMDPIRQAASGLAAQTGGKVRAVFEQNGIGVGVLNQEEETINRDAAAKAQEMGFTR